MAKIILAKGGEQTVTPDNGKYFSLDFMQKAVGGWIEIVGDGKHLYICDEEAKIKGKPRNEVATRMAGLVNDYFAGDVLVCAPDEVE